jgi:hypothetical protein
VTPKEIQQTGATKFSKPATSRAKTATKFPKPGASRAKTATKL